MSHWDEPFWCPPVWRTPDPCVVVELPGGIELMADRAGEFTLASWEGWINGPEVRGGSVEWESADGGVPGDVFFTGRNLAFDGLIKARSASHLWELQEELGGVLTRERWGTLKVYEAHLGLERQVTVARGGRPTITPLTDTVARYAVQFQSPSPYRLGVDQQSAEIPPGRVNLRNVGNHDADVMGTIIGPRTNPEFSWPGGSWRYNGTVADGQTLQVDFARRVVRDPATTRHSRNLAQGTWLTLPPGTTSVSRNGGGAGSQHLSWRSTWA